MKNNIKIITPFYNPGKFLEQCIATAIFKNHKVFVKNNIWKYGK